MHRIEVILPPLDSNGVQEIREGSIIRPYLPNKRLPFYLQEHILLQSILILSVVVNGKRSRSCARIDKRDISHALSMKAIDEIRETLVSYLIVIDKVTVVLHVVDIRPHHIKGDVVASVTLQDTLEDIQASIAVSALVPSKTPLRNKYRLSN
jgi:hypothetical protein